MRSIWKNILAVSICALTVAIVAIWHEYNTTSVDALLTDINRLETQQAQFTTQSLAPSCTLSPQWQELLASYKKKLRVMYRERAWAAATFKHLLEPVIKQTDSNTQKHCILTELSNYIDYMITNENLFSWRMRE